MTVARVERPPIAGLLRVRGYGTIATGSLLWHTNRWGALFATTLRPEGAGDRRGAVTTAVGAMPIGMLVIGTASLWLGPPGAVLLSAALGVVMLLVVGVGWNRTPSGASQRAPSENGRGIRPRSMAPPPAGRATETRTTGAVE